MTTVAHVVFNEFLSKFYTILRIVSGLTKSIFENNRINGDEDLVLFRLFGGHLGKTSFLGIITKILYRNYLLKYILKSEFRMAAEKNVSKISINMA